MLSQQQLNSWLGQNIANICSNGYDNSSLNHCAHFVGHALSIGVGYTCRHHTGRSNFGACLRVHELFAACSQHVEVNQCSIHYEGIVFVSAASSFVTQNGRVAMQNVPRKHVGMVYQGNVWHYSNTQDMVIMQPMSQFLFHYRGQQNALWVATPPSNYRARTFGVD
ncbi:MAG: hypothetical protein ABL921_06760 [Pirellula sp.]